ncbi:FadR/GntR family transcriptional regulator [Sphaerisporangium flaviroseum]|uniref:FadR/GntR family transcriptional regulator n=1 Tax=Sphaerisporangium flaviroseum TaxID=509199 RepID=A0ABP7HT24_9ACTN
MTEPGIGDAQPSPSAPEQLAMSLRRGIALGTFEPGARLPNERTLADRLGVSRMTVRAAMRMLALEGLVTTSRGRSGGTFVASTPIQEAYGSQEAQGIDRFVAQVHDNFEVRLAVEPLAAQLAAERATAPERATVLDLLDTSVSGIRHYRMLDSRFHLLIAQASGNTSLAQIIEGLRTEFFLWADAAWARLDWDLLTPPEQDFGLTHRRLAEAIVDGDPDRSRALMEAHIEDGLRQLKSVIASASRTHPS